MRAAAARRLRRVFRGVYAVGHTQLKREGWWMAALLACGDDSVISHDSAAQAAGIAGGPPFPIHVSTETARGRRQARLTTHRQGLVPSETFAMEGLRVTTTPRTILDQASVVTPRDLRLLVERSQDRHLFDAQNLGAVVDRHPGRAGTRPLKDLVRLMQPDDDKARSYLERLFLAAIRSYRLPLPEVNFAIKGKQRDFVWPEQRLVVEVDGYAYHSSRAAMRLDRRRDRELTALGWRPARFSYEDVAFEPDAAMRELAGLLELAVPSPR